MIMPEIVTDIRRPDGRARRIHLTAEMARVVLLPAPQRNQEVTRASAIDLPRHALCNAACSERSTARWR